MVYHRASGVLGPTLFLLFINDVTDIFDGLSVTCKLYADDIKLYTSYCFNQLHSNLVDATERLIAWADNWQLKLAADKCIVCRLKQSQWPISWDASNTEYKINDSTLQYKDNVRDLGVIIDCNLKFEQHISNVVHKAHNRANLILKCFNSRDRVLLTKAFCTYVRPLLEYCTPVWSPQYKYLIEKIERVQRHFTKRMQGLKNKTYTERLKLTGIESLERRRLNYDLVLTYKILFGVVDLQVHSLFQLAPYSSTRGHSFKLYKKNTSVRVRSSFFSERVVNVWNKLPESVVFSSLASFARSIKCIDLSDFVTCYQ